MTKKNLNDIAFINEEEYDRKRRLLRYTILITFPFTGIYTLLFFYNHVYINAAVQFFCFIGFAALLVLVRRHFTTSFIAWLYVLFGAISIYSSVYYTGGLYSVGLGWLVSQPPIALLIGTRRHGFAAAIGAFIFMVTLSVLHNSGYEFPPTNAQFTSNISNIFSGFVGLFGLMFLVSLVFENGKNSALLKLADKNRIVEQERKRSDTLLLNILPEEVAAELKEEGKTHARKYQQATILFCDFVAFSKIAESLKPEELVILIDAYFRKFDDIMEKYGIEKIKTVGDAYLAASGVPDEREHNALQVIYAAKEMLAFAKSRETESHHFQLRIGINTGTVIAGVVGRAKFAFDIWGDAVNIAARMEQNCEPGTINISESTFDLVQDIIPCTYRGGIEAKNKGVLKMYTVQ